MSDEASLTAIVEKLLNLPVTAWHCPSTPHESHQCDSIEAVSKTAVLLLANEILASHARAVEALTLQLHSGTHDLNEADRKIEVLEAALTAKDQQLRDLKEEAGEREVFISGLFEVKEQAETALAEARQQFAAPRKSESVSE